MGRRGENIRRRKDGRWEARVVQGRPICGKSNYKYFYGKSYQEVKQKKKAFLTERPPKPPKTTLPPKAAGSEGALLFREIAANWLASKKSVVKESTFACYSIMVEKHLLPALGELPAGEITTDRLTSFLGEKRSTGGCAGRAFLTTPSTPFATPSLHGAWKTA
ncbi:MAG: hypothetical protein LUG55_10375 [Clostridiales bacterium]|nr:hypothetical protein [Clostridiales bacterium]